MTRIVEYTLSAMSLSVGDAILDVDSIPVTTVADTSTAISNGLQKAGYVILFRSGSSLFFTKIVRHIILDSLTLSGQMNSADRGRRSAGLLFSGPLSACMISILQTSN